MRRLLSAGGACHARLRPGLHRGRAGGRTVRHTHSDDTQYITRDEPVNIDRSKTAAVIPPAFGSPTSYTLNSGTLLTPNLVDQDWAAQVTVSGNGTGTVVMPPALSGGAVSSGGSSFAVTQYTEVTDDLYYSGGYLGTLKIPAIGLSVKVYQGTGSATLARGAGHFADTSIWDGNCCIAGHNRGSGMILETSTPWSMEIPSPGPPSWAPVPMRWSASRKCWRRMTAAPRPPQTTA